MPSDGDRRIFWTTAALVILVDFITKLVAESALLHTAAVPMFGDWFQLRLVYNRGAAFGLHVGAFSRWVFLGVAVIPIGDRFRQVALGLVAGGAAGNLVDRVRSARGVVDFLDVGIGTLRWPTFNVADIAVSCGAIALALSLWREDSRRPAPEPVSPA